MLSLQSLPTELLLDIYLYLEDVHSATQLSRTRNRFFDIWSANEDRIVIQILRRQILAFDEALLLQITRRTLSMERTDTELDQIKAVLPELEESNEICGRLLPLHHDCYMNIMQYEEPCDANVVARGFYISRLLVLAYEVPHLRRDVRRKVKRLSEDDLEVQQSFISWLENFLKDEDLRDWLELEIWKVHPDLHYSYQDGEIQDRWRFADETTMFYIRRKKEKDKPIGLNGLWSNVTGSGYQESWW